MKINKDEFTKQEWHTLREKRRIDKEVSRQIKERQQKGLDVTNYSLDQERKDHFQLNSFVIGNGTSRKPIQLPELYPLGPIYACNAVYREFVPDYLVAVDVKMILEIAKSGYQNRNEVWTNNNKAYEKINNLNYFNPSKGWSSGPTALWLAAQHGHRNIFILGFDYKGVGDEQTKFNNVFADTFNYKKSIDGATYYGNWLRQTKAVIQEHKDINFIRVIRPDNYDPDELNKFSNYSTIYVESFIKMFGLSQNTLF